MITILKKINKCIYTGEKYHILFFCKSDVNRLFINNLKSIDDLFDQNDYLKQNQIIGFCNIHKLNNIEYYDILLKKDVQLKKLIYYPSSVYIRDDYRNKGVGTLLYKHMLWSIKAIHGRNRIKYPYFVQHEVAESWATTSEYSKKIYNKLLKEDYIKKVKKPEPDLYQGWYQINLHNIGTNSIKGGFDTNFLVRDIGDLLDES